VQKCYDRLRSQGLAVSKDTLHAYLGHLEDAFLVGTVFLHTASERQRMVNPRKAYPADPGLIPLYERSGRPNLGHALETAVFLELERRGYELAYVRTGEGLEVDFLATAPGQPRLLVQACLDVHGSETWEREVRALAAAAKEHPRTVPLLLTLDSLAPRPSLPKPLRWLPAVAWFLGASPG
jgi:predicted AAA+ superfamily ATPase